MILIETEKLITLADATALVPGIGGKPVHYQTIHRWANKGLRGVKLETVFCGGRRCTTREAIQRFVERITSDREKDSSVTESLSRRQPSQETKRLMREHGLC